uniref:Uncharacterized protein n=1 Tax=viral metagenome TaxID=1070528 RepID=A0A6C0HGB0_9ZZZZ
MSALTRLLMLYLTVAILSLVITTLFAFFGIGFDIYGNYLLWFIALAILYSILPKESGTLFNGSNPV